MNTLRRFVDHMMYRFGYTRQEQDTETSSGERKRLRTGEPGLEGERFSDERAVVTEAVAKRMELGVRAGASAGRRSTGEEKRERNSPSRTGYERTDREHGTEYAGAPRPRLQFQQIWPEQQVAPSEDEQHGKVWREGFFNALKEARTNLWVAEFKEFPRSAFGLSDTVSDGTSARNGKQGADHGQKADSEVPIWEINPQIAGDVPESIAHAFRQERGFPDQHRLVIVLSKNPDMERVRDISRHLAETNVQKVLMGGPEMLELMVSYPADILDNCAQITFLVDNANMSAHEKATLAVVQRRIQQETSIPVNLECYGLQKGWNERAQVRSGEVHPAEMTQNGRNLSRMPRPAMPEPAMPEPAVPEPAVPNPTVAVPAMPVPVLPGTESPNIRLEMQNAAPSMVPQPAGSRKQMGGGVHPGDGYAGGGRYLPRNHPDFRAGGGVAPGFSPNPALTAAYTPPKRGSAERQPSTEKQIVYAKTMLERLGFNTETINEQYRKLHVPIGWVGRPVNEFLARLDRQAISFLIDTLKQLEQAHLRAQMKEAGLSGQQRGGVAATMPPTAPAPAVPTAVASQVPPAPPEVQGESTGQENTGWGNAGHAPTHAPTEVGQVKEAETESVSGGVRHEQSIPSPAVTAVAGGNMAQVPYAAADMTVPADADMAKGSPEAYPPQAYSTQAYPPQAYPGVENRYRYESPTVDPEGPTVYGGETVRDGQFGGTTFASPPKKGPENPLPIRPFPSGPMR